MNFIRGKDPKEALSIGIASKIDLYMEDLIKTYGYSLCNQETLVKRNKEVSNFFGLDIEIILLNKADTNTLRADEIKIRVICKKIGYSKEFFLLLPGLFKFPKITRVAPKTIGSDLVSMKPMKSPESNRFK
jgi:hypothetical protein